MMKMFQLYPRMPGPSGVAIQHLFACAFAAVVFPDPAVTASGTDIRYAEQDAAIYLPHLELAIVAAPVGEVSYAMQRWQLASYLQIDLLTIDLGREAGRVEVRSTMARPPIAGARQRHIRYCGWVTPASILSRPV